MANETKVIIRTDYCENSVHVSLADDVKYIIFILPLLLSKNVTVILTRNVHDSIDEPTKIGVCVASHVYIFSTRFIFTSWSHCFILFQYYGFAAYWNIYSNVTA